LQLIADELKNYPEIELKWFERGIQFQIQFINKAFNGSGKNQLSPETGLSLAELGDKLGIDLEKNGTKLEQLDAENGTKLGGRFRKKWH
jgi:ATP-dependent DNA helicase RecG